MIDGQATFSLANDYDRADPSGASTTADLEGSWSQFTPVMFGTYGLRSVTDAATESFRNLEERWAEDQPEGRATAGHRWCMRSSNAGATSPLLLVVGEIDENSSFDSLLTCLKYGPSRENREHLADRLSELRRDLADDEDSPSLSKASVLGLLRFLEINRKVRDPSLIATNSGNIRAEWHESWSQHFVIEFISDADARFVVFIRDHNAKGKKVRVSITCSVASVLEQALPHGIDAWVMRA